MEENNLFFVCSLVEYIARLTQNEKKVIVEKLGKEKLKKIYELADVYHSENILKVANELTKECNIEMGSYILNLKDSLPTFWDIGKIYQRLIIMLDNSPNSFIDNLCEVLSSWLVKKIDDYESSMYYETPEYIYECYKNGKIL